MDRERVDYQTKDGYDTRAKWEDMLMYERKDSPEFRQFFFQIEIPKNEIKIDIEEIKIEITNKEVKVQTHGIQDKKPNIFWFPPIPIFYSNILEYIIIINENLYFKGKLKPEYFDSNINKKKQVKINLKKTQKDFNDFEKIEVINDSEKNPGKGFILNQYFDINKYYEMIKLLGNKKSVFTKNRSKGFGNNSNGYPVNFRSAFSSKNKTKSALKVAEDDVNDNSSKDNKNLFDNIANKGKLSIFFENVDIGQINFFSFDIKNFGLVNKGWIFNQDIINPRFRISFVTEDNKTNPLRLAQSKYQFSIAIQSEKNRNDHFLVRI